MRGEVVVQRGDVAWLAQGHAGARQEPDHREPLEITPDGGEVRGAEVVEDLARDLGLLAEGGRQRESGHEGGHRLHVGAQLDHELRDRVGVAGVDPPEDRIREMDRRRVRIGAGRDLQRPFRPGRRVRVPALDERGRGVHA